MAPFFLVFQNCIYYNFKSDAKIESYFISANNLGLNFIKNKVNSFISTEISISQRDKDLIKIATFAIINNVY